MKWIFQKKKLMQAGNSNKVIKNTTGKMNSKNNLVYKEKLKEFLTLKVSGKFIIF